MVVADLNHDGRPDLIALASGLTELVWYENPGWQRHVLASGQSRMINCVVIGNEIVLASEFANQAKDSIGIVSVLRPGPDPREPWTVTEIDRLPTSHRLRVADIDGSGKLVVVNAALTGAAATAPDYRDQTPLVYYVPGEWKRRVISTENSGVVHGIFVTDWDGNGRQSILTASFTGIHLFRYDQGPALDAHRNRQGRSRPLAQIRLERYCRRTLRRRVRQNAISRRHRALARQSGRRLHPARRAVGTRGDRYHPARRPHHPGRRFQRRWQGRNRRRLPRPTAQRLYLHLRRRGQTLDALRPRQRQAWAPPPAPSPT